MTATLYLGSHHATARWWALGVPLCVSYRVMRERRRLPEARAPWILDSGAFTERLIGYLADHRLRLHGFGLKGDTFRALRGQLVSADSQAWSAAARWEGRDSNSPTEAMQWRARLVAS